MRNALRRLLSTGSRLDADAEQRERIVRLFYAQRNRINLTVVDVRARTGLYHKDAERILKDMEADGILRSFIQTRGPRERKYWLANY